MSVATFFISSKAGKYRGLLLSQTSDSDTVPTTAVPEPSSSALRDVTDTYYRCFAHSSFFSACLGFIRFLYGIHMSNSSRQVEIWFSLGSLQKALKLVIEWKVLMLQGCTSQPCKAPQGSLSPAQMRFTLSKDSFSVLEKWHRLWSPSQVLHATTTPGYLSTWALICIHSLMNLKSSYCTLQVLRWWRTTAAGCNFLCICKTGEQPPARLKIYCKKASAARACTCS